jgi:hypothetical protein
VTPPRFFTPPEADALLPEVRQQLELMRESLAFLRRASAGANQIVEGLHGEEPTPLYGWALERLDDAQRRLTDLGIEIRDVDRGLVDFPALQGDQVVMLCWLEGEDRVEWFHEPGMGFGGRRPLAELEQTS